MIKTWIFVLTMTFANGAFANTQHEYDSGTAENIQSIYWLTKAEDSAIVYARFEGFYALRDLIDQTILAGNTSSKVDVDLDSADKLLLMMPEQENILEILITDNHLIFNGLNYQLDSDLINKIKAMNDYRIDKGDLISPSSLSIAMERFGFNR
ncbi:hypothetical protein ORJ04_21175 [Rheinheimera baltica]|uniref:Uncharacterized protein n=1 Tax=Rheinheimera baltica TaxID=67576 RepID=A0ABT9I4Z6_9GAMM|nr:hypothetical protein [Rheinheimera baltica]MDP5138464.1 hypothetical protein [Rheinheimera baltica]MDP5149357.1 hypothetical protein [Rheinheimera baltica]